MTFKIATSSYDFALKRISANIQKHEEYQFWSVSVNVPFEMPENLKASEFEAAVAAYLKKTLIDAANFDMN